MTTEHNCIIAVPEDGEAILVKSDPSLTEYFDGCFLGDNYVKGVPEEPGVYSCVIKIESWGGGYGPDGPEEYDFEHTITSCSKVL